MFKPLVEMIEDGFRETSETVSQKTEEQDLQLAELAAEVEYMACLSELQSDLAI